MVHCSSNVFFFFLLLFFHSIVLVFIYLFIYCSSWFLIIFPLHSMHLMVHCHVHRASLLIRYHIAVLVCFISPAVTLLMVEGTTVHLSRNVFLRLLGEIREHCVTTVHNVEINQNNNKFITSSTKSICSRGGAEAIII